MSGRGLRQVVVFCGVGFGLIGAFLFPSPAYSSSKLTVGNIEYDFGKVPEGDVVRHSFEFVNDGDDTLAVYSVQKSCGCSRASVSDSFLAPGETATVDVAFYTGGYRGLSARYVDLYTSAPAGGAKRFTMKGSIETPKPATAASPTNENNGRVFKDSSLLSGPRPVMGAAPLDVNRATEEDLARIPNVGRELARSILDTRRKLGGFHDAQGILQVPGIRKEELEELQKYLIVGDTADSARISSPIKK